MLRPLPVLLGLALIAQMVQDVRVAHAGPAVLATVAPATDARRAVAIGPAGQVYEPDGKGAWVRKHAGGIAVEIIAAANAGGNVIAGAKNAPPFKLKGGAWTALNLGVKPKAILGTGSRVLAAVGKTVFALDAARPKKLADAPAPIRALGASATGAVIATDRGLARLEGTAFKPMKKGPKKVQALIGDRWALLDRGAFDLKIMKLTAWPAGLRVAEAVTVGDALFAVAAHGKTLELLTIKAGKLERDKVPLPDAKPVVGIVADKAGRIVIALRDGTIALRDGTTWTTTTVREELAPPKPGPAPATSN